MAFWPSLLLNEESERDIPHSGDGADSVVGVANRVSSSCRKHTFSRVPSLHGRYPASPLLWTPPTPVWTGPALCLPQVRGGHHPRPYGPLRFLDRPLRTRRPLSPRQARQTLVLVVHLPATGFTTLWRVGHLHTCNEAETGSLSLRLMRPFLGASTTGLLPPPPDSLHGERASSTVTTFQVTRSVRLGLTHQSTQRKEEDGDRASYCPKSWPICENRRNLSSVSGHRLRCWTAGDAPGPELPYLHGDWSVPCIPGPIFSYSLRLTFTLVSTLTGPSRSVFPLRIRFDRSTHTRGGTRN